VVSVPRPPRAGVHTGSFPGATHLGSTTSFWCGLEAEGLELGEKGFRTLNLNRDPFSGLAVQPGKPGRARRTEIRRSDVAERRLLLSIVLTGFHGALHFLLRLSARPSPRWPTEVHPLSTTTGCYFLLPSLSEVALVHRSSSSQSTNAGSYTSYTGTFPAFTRNYARQRQNDGEDRGKERPKIAAAFEVRMPRSPGSSPGVNGTQVNGRCG